MKFESTPPSGPERPQVEESPSAGHTRRGFLKTLGQAAFGAAAAGIESSTPVKAAEALSPRRKEHLEKIAQLQRDLQAWERVIVEGRVYENFRYLKEKFGGAAEALLGETARQAHLDFRAAKDQVERNTKSRDPANEDWSQLEIASRQYHRFWNAQALERRLVEREAREGLGATIEGFDGLAGWSDASIKRLLELHFDRRWLYGNISTFGYIDRPERQAHYGVVGRAAGRGLASVLTKSQGQTVSIYQQDEPDEREMLRVMAHEIGHHHDWENSNRLPIHERLSMLREVSERFETIDRTITPYLDLDIPQEYAERLDPAEMRYRQVKEFWATLMERHATNPNLLRSTSPNDFALAEKWYRRLTRDFDH